MFGTNFASTSLGSFFWGFRIEDSEYLTAPENFVALEDVIPLNRGDIFSGSNFNLPGCIPKKKPASRIFDVGPKIDGV